MSDLPPELEESLHDPHAIRLQDHLAVGDGHRLYYQESGSQAGIPVVCLHGGPGSGSSATLTRFFDPERYRVVVYDQRGAGRSEPRGELRGNTTPALVAGLEALRQHLGIERWLVFGGSWGATLALCYAQAHRAHVRGLILRGPLLGRPSELDWFFGPNGVARIYPREYEAFVDALPLGLRELPLRGYAAFFRSRPDEAALGWGQWDHRVATGRVIDDTARIDPAACVIACHYAVNGFFLSDHGLLADMDAVRGLPGTIVQGQLDLVCPAANAVTLVHYWPEAELRTVDGAGHLSTDPGIARELVDATNRFASAAA